MVEEMIDWKSHVQLWIHNKSRVGRQKILFFLGFKFDLRFFEDFKTTSYLHFWVFYLSTSVSLFHFKPMLSFYTMV